MKRNLFILLLAFALIAPLVFAGGKKETTSVSQTTGEPQYGGTLTLYTGKAAADPPSADPRDAQSNAFPYWQTIQEMLFMGDFEKYGPRGTGEFAFQQRDRMPPQYMTGCLLESWEVTHDKVVMHVRPGIYWAADNVDFMESRELTGEDIAWDINEFWHDIPAWGGRFNGVLKDVYATDKYTVVCEFEKYQSFFLYWVGLEDRGTYGPPEVRKVDATKWENCVGTGPWMFGEEVLGSYISFVRNPNYWRKTPIDGKEYQVPFMDKVVYPIIADEATHIAALRTGKIDFNDAVPITQLESLKATNPDLISASYILAGHNLNFQHKEKPFNDRNVRRALMVGTDLAAFQPLGNVVGEPIHFYPILPSSTFVYTPQDKLPEDIQILYKYDPTLAKKMLADAGYPNGLTTSLHCENTAINLNKASLIKDQWSKIGVTVNIKPHDSTNFATLERGVTYDGTLVGSDSLVDPVGNVYELGHTRTTGGWKNNGDWSDPNYDKLVSDMMYSLDEKEVNAMCKQAAEILLREVVAIPLFPEKTCHFYWPWIRNYYGEKTIADLQAIQILSYAWIDQEMKKKMGF